MKVAFVELQGLRTRYLIAGTGPLLVLIHPVGYPAEIFARNIDALAMNFTVVAPDLPGQGFSEAPTVWQCPPQSFMANHVAKLVDHLGYERYSVLGSSLGGLIAALLALRDIPRVEHLVVVGSGSVFNDPAGQPEVLKKVYANGSKAYSDPSLASCKERIANTCYVPPVADDILLAHITAYAWPSASTDYRNIIEGVSAAMSDREATVYHRLEHIRAKTLIVIGNNDTRTSPATHKDGARRIPDARLVQFNDCGHLPYLEHAEAFNRLLVSFLHGHEAGVR